VQEILQNLLAQFRICQVANSAVMLRKIILAQYVIEFPMLILYYAARFQGNNQNIQISRFSCGKIVPLTPSPPHPPCHVHFDGFALEVAFFTRFEGIIKKGCEVYRGFRGCKMKVHWLG